MSTKAQKAPGSRVKVRARGAPPRGSHDEHNSGPRQRLACVLSERATALRRSPTSAAADSAWARSTRASETGSTSPAGPPSRTSWTGPRRFRSPPRHPVSKDDDSAKFAFLHREKREEGNGGAAHTRSDVVHANSAKARILQIWLHRKSRIYYNFVEKVILFLRASLSH